MTATVDVNNEAGTMVVDFNWGPGGYTPSSADDFNFFGFLYTMPAGMTNDQLQTASAGAYGPGKIVVNQSPLDAVLGSAAPTYLECSSGYCAFRSRRPMS